MSYTTLLPIVSARNYATGKYKLLADGNIQAMLNIFSGTLRNERCLLYVPANSEDYTAFKQVLADLFPATKLEKLVYGENVQDTRARFTELNPAIQYANIGSIPGVAYGTYFATTSPQHGFTQPCDAFNRQHMQSVVQSKQVLVHDIGQLELLRLQGFGNKTRLVHSLAKLQKFYMDYWLNKPCKEPSLADGTLLCTFNHANPEYSNAADICTKWQLGPVATTNVRNGPVMPPYCNELLLMPDDPIEAKAYYYKLLEKATYVLAPGNKRVFHCLNAELEYLGYKRLNQELQIYAKSL